MAHPYRIRDIATQAGLSQATVDRVLHARGGVRATTVREVERAVEELRRQETQVRLTGRTFLLDVVVDAPARFSAAVRTALERVQPTLRPAVLRSRFHLREDAGVDELVDLLDSAGARGSHGVLLKAPDVPAVGEAVDRLHRNGVPVITLVTDLPTSRRLAYVGLDNTAAGATAGYLLGQWLGPAGGTVLVTRGGSTFHGEDQRRRGFAQVLADRFPAVRTVELSGSLAHDDLVRDGVERALRLDPALRAPTPVAIYSLYATGGNGATAAAFAGVGREPVAFVAHDLDGENAGLLREGILSAVLHHDLDLDLHRAAVAVLQAHGALPGAATSWPSSVQVLTPYNLPLPGPRGRF